jgi:quinol monooxygenase YgiN
VYIRVTRGRFEPEESGAVEAMSSDVADAIKVLPGFVAYHGGIDRNAGTMVAISSWEDRSSAEFPREKLGDVMRRVTEVAQLEPAEIYEVMVTA